MRFHAVQCVRCLRTSAAQKQVVGTAIPLHARPQPQAGPSKPSLISRVASKQRSSTLPSLIPPVQTPSPIEILERALQTNHLTLAYDIQRHLDQERIPLSAAQHSRIERAWAIHSAKRKRPKRLPSYLLQSTATSTLVDQQTLLDLIHHSLRSPPPHPRLGTILSIFKSPHYDALQILHQFLHPDLASNLHPNPSTISQNSIQPTTKTLTLYLRNLSRKQQRSKRAIALLLLFEKRWQVKPDRYCWRLVVRYVNQEGNKEGAEWVVIRAGARFRPFLERRGLVRPLAVSQTGPTLEVVDALENLGEQQAGASDPVPLQVIERETEKLSLYNRTAQSLSVTPPISTPQPTPVKVNPT